MALHSCALKLLRYCPQFSLHQTSSYFGMSYPISIQKVQRSILAYWVESHMPILYSYALTNTQNSGKCIKETGNEVKKKFNAYYRCSHQRAGQQCPVAHYPTGSSFKQIEHHACQQLELIAASDDELKFIY